MTMVPSIIISVFVLFVMEFFIVVVKLGVSFLRIIFLYVSFL